MHPARVIDFHEIIFITKGEVFICENEAYYCVKENEILVLQPNLKHYGYKTSADTEFFWIHWHGGPEIPSHMKHRKIENPYNISVYFRLLLDARVTKKSQESMDYLTRLILIELYSNSQQPNTSHIAEKAAALINAKCHLAVTEAQIAAELGYNADYLNRIFKTAFSKTVKQCINEKRMEYIKTLMLCDSLPLKHISDKCGFAEYKYFLKFFKYHEKITPTEFYKQYAKMYINSR